MKGFLKIFKLLLLYSSYSLDFFPEFPAFSSNFGCIWFCFANLFKFHAIKIVCFIFYYPLYLLFGLLSIDLISNSFHAPLIYSYNSLCLNYVPILSLFWYMVRDVGLCLVSARLFSNFSSSFC